MRILLYPMAFAPDIEQHLAAGDEIVQATSEEMFVDRLPDTDVVVSNRWKEAWNRYLDGIEFFQSASAGVDHFPLQAFRDHDVPVANASGVHPEPIAEHVFGMLLSWERQLFTAHAAQQEQEWLDMPPPQPREISGATMAVIGVGAIGGQIAATAASFDMTIRGLDLEQDADAVDQWYGPDELEQCLDGASYVVLACPLNDGTRNLLDSDAFAAMDDDAVLINIARGAVVDRDALLTALREDRIRAALLDVFHQEPLPDDSPFWELQNCLVSPHCAGLTPRYGERLAGILEKNLKALREGTELPTGIDPA